MKEATLEKITKTLKDNDIVLYMKGTPDFPQCGFSYRVAEILNELNVTYQAVNVLDDHEIREGIKEHSNWPTIPQLYIKGELVGGCDIICQIKESGELAKMLEDFIVT